mmetsp:Transcript_45479/g.120100  ORF Transcript_45479/g.120100 Transcript_45479/m.120100 type:complete len:84 (+) Transcript_45479:399-650(+)
MLRVQTFEVKWKCGESVFSGRQLVGHVGVALLRGQHRTVGETSTLCWAPRTFSASVFSVSCCCLLWSIAAGCLWAAALLPSGQ